MSARLRTVFTPAASSAANFSSAVPLPPAMMAPAWPIRLPFGAVTPAIWKLVGMEGYEPQRAIVKRLLNEGIIQVPTTDDGRYTNVASINVKNALFRNADDYRAALTSLEQQRQAAVDPVQQHRLQDRIALIKALNDF
jgi:hypothetical protein